MFYRIKIINIINIKSLFFLFYNYVLNKAIKVLESIDSKYIIEDKKDIEPQLMFIQCMNNEEKFYATKVLKESSNLFEKEINILNTLKSANNQNIVNIISSGEGLSKNQYLVHEYTSKDEVFNYIY